MKNKKLLLSCILLGVTIVFIIMVCVFDVSDKGLIGSHLGFTKLNTFMSARLPYNDTSRQISRYLGAFWFLPPVPFLIICLIQFKNRKSLKKIDLSLFFLLAFYLVMGTTYLISRRIFINYRPIFLDGELEYSFPSSHTLFSVCVTASTILILNYYVKFKKYRHFRPYSVAASVSLILLCILTVGSRYLAGVHWTTDIIGGSLIALTYAAFLDYCLSYCPQPVKPKPENPQLNPKPEHSRPMNSQPDNPRPLNSRLTKSQPTIRSQNVKNR